MASYSNRIYKYHVLLGVLGTTILLPVIHAEETEQIVHDLPGIVVTATSSGNPQPSLAKLPMSIQETPQSVSVISKKVLEQQNSTELEEAMNHATGIIVQPFVLLTTAYYARGFKINSFEIDGVPVAMVGMASPPQDLSSYEQIEILRGANGLLHGSGNPSATINFVSKKPSQDFKGNIALSAGSFDNYRGDIDVQGPLNKAGTVRGRLSAAYNDRGFQADIAKQQNKILYGITEFDLSPTTMISIGGNYQRITSTTDMAGVPMDQDGKSLNLPRSTYLNTDWSQFNWTVKRVFGSVKQELPHDWLVTLSGEYQKTDSFLKYAGLYGAIDRETGDGAMLMGGAHKFKTYSKSADLNAQGSVNLFGREHDLLIGASYSANRSIDYNSNLNMKELYAPFNVYTWNPKGIADPTITPFKIGANNKISQMGIYGLGRFKLADQLTLIAGGRVSKWKQESLKETNKLGTQFTPYGGLVWDFQDNWSAYLSYAEVFEPQTATTWEGSTLPPVKGKSYELGTKATLFDDSLLVSFAMFNIDLQNNPQEDPNHPCVGRVCYYTSGGKVRSQGFEMEAIGNITPYWNISAGYTYSDTKYKKDIMNEGKKYASFNPRHILRIWTNYDLPFDHRRWSVGAGVQAQSEFSTQSGDLTIRQGGHAITNLRLGYKMDKDWDVALNVNNVFDRKYYQSLFGLQWSNRYGNRRNFAVTFRANF